MARLDLPELASPDKDAVVYRATLGALVVVSIPVFWVYDAVGVFGLSLGFVAAAVNMVGWVLAARWLGGLMKAGAKPGGGTSLLLLMFFVKLPLLFIAGFLAQSIGTTCLGCFLGGLGLVYFGFVGWSLVQR